MGHTNPLSAENDVLVDTNIFFAIGHPANHQYARLRSAVRNAGIVMKLSQRVIGELGGSDTERVRSAIKEGCAEIIDAPPQQMVTLSQPAISLCEPSRLKLIDLSMKSKRQI